MKRLSTLLLLLAVPLALVGCDDEEVLEDGTTAYRVTFSPLNDSGVSGTASFVIDDEADLLSDDDDTFTAMVNATGLAPNMTHAQHIHAAAACPDDEADDANDDGFLDVLEGAPVYGGILVPLDGNLLDRGTQLESFPQGSAIDYEEDADFDDFLATYQVADDNPDDAIVTLGVNGDLNLDGRTVVLHGTDQDVPGTVQTIPNSGLDAATTLPVACGTIELVTVN